jgi:hypothetical protein
LIAKSAIASTALHQQDKMLSPELAHNWSSSQMRRQRARRIILSGAVE